MTEEWREGLKASIADFAAVFRLVTNCPPPLKKRLLSFEPILVPRVFWLFGQRSNPSNYSGIMGLDLFLIGRQQHEGGPTSVVRQEVDRPWDPTNQSENYTRNKAKSSVLLPRKQRNTITPTSYKKIKSIKRSCLLTQLPGSSTVTLRSATQLLHLLRC